MLALGTAAAIVPPTARAEIRSTGFVLEHPRGGKAVAGRGFNLFDAYNRRYVHVREAKPQAIEGSSARRDDVEIVTDKGGALVCGEPFTLRIAQSTLTLDPKGREVVLASLPRAPEWAFYGCKSGEPLPLGRPLALANVRRGDAWVGCKRHGEADFCWDDEQLMGIAVR